MKFSALVVLCVIAMAATTFAAQDAAKSAPLDPSVARPMKAEELKKRIDAGEKVVVVDGRSQLDGEIMKGAVHVTEEDLVSWSDSAPKDVPLVFYCTCEDDGIAINDVIGLQNLGFTNAYYLEGGLEAARKAGIPVIKPGS